MWKTLQEIRKFTPKTEMDRILGVSPVQIEDRPAWYYGGGFVLHFSPVRFRVEGIQRAEYGEPGEYVVGGVITYQSTFQEIHRRAARCSLEYYSEGETRRQAEGGMAFLKRRIAWEQCEFHFYGKSGKAKVSGFRFVQPE